MAESILCIHCQTKTVKLKSDPNDKVKAWQCHNCGELRYWCPACDQGWILHAVVKKDGTSIRLCEECETLWFSTSQIGTEECKNFSIYMESIDLNGLWEEIEILRDIH
jgi:hypothetical protein